MLTEKEGCALLKALFEKRGYAIVENVDFKEADVSFNCDGWDAEKRVGFEYMTLQERDHEDLDPDELLRINEWISEGKLFLFIVDETEVESAEELVEAAVRFLDEVEKRIA
ncbi:MAG: hypothetical protein GY822_24870 [Deltaproteobacteria bacterium]|nr:hypothetical protein [Deltaproteobacteria bacterium]